MVILTQTGTDILSKILMDQFGPIFSFSLNPSSPVNVPVFEISGIWNIEWSTPMLTSETNHLHYISKLASYKDKPFIVGHFEYFAGNNKAELLDLQTNSWSQMADYPFHESWVGPSDGHRDWRCDITITLANLAFKVFTLGPPRTANYNLEFSINGYSAISMKDSVIIFGGDTIGLSITVTLKIDLDWR